MARRRRREVRRATGSVTIYAWSFLPMALFLVAAIAPHFLSSTRRPSSVLRDELACQVLRAGRCEVKREPEDLRRLARPLHRDAPHDLRHEALLLLGGRLL